MIRDFTADNAELLRKAADGDGEARNELIINNMGLVHSVVMRFLGRGHEADDLFQIGCIGLIRAAERFDPTFNVRFSTYAVPMIMGEIKRFLRDDGIIKVSRSLKELAANAARIEKQLTAEKGTAPPISEIADKMGISAAELAAAVEAQAQPQSLYMTADDGSGESRPLIDKIESKSDDMGEMLDRMLLSQLMSKLGERDKKIIYFRYYLGKTQAQIAERLGVSQVQISRLEKKILGKMREMLQN